MRAKPDDTVWWHEEERERMTLMATKAAFAALGIDPRHEAEDADADATEEPPHVGAKSPKIREPKVPRKDSRQARLIAMLHRPKGTSIDEVAEALEWQPHTVRGAIAGALKKRLGLDVTSETDDKRGRVYRIVNVG